MKKVVAVLLALGILLAGGGVLQAANLSVSADVQSALTLILSPTGLSFTGVQQGVASTAQTLTATTTGSGSYQLQLTGASFNGPQTVSASALEFKEASAGTYTAAATTAKNMLAANGTAVAGGDAKTFDIRVNFPASTQNGTYTSSVVITAVPQ
ncbi:MAG: hypothetical protein ACOY46_10920 [Bacillota bacterium]